MLVFLVQTFRALAFCILIIFILVLLVNSTFWSWVQFWHNHWHNKLMYSVFYCDIDRFEEEVFSIVLFSIDRKLFMMFN